MNKKILIGVVVLLVVVATGYFYTSNRKDDLNYERQKEELVIRPYRAE